MSKKTPERIEEILNGLRQGLAHKHAAGAAGVGESTWNKWRREDEELAESAENAIAFFVQSQHTKVVEGPHADPKWLLERRAPEEYGKRDKIKHEFVLEMPSLLPPEALKVDWAVLDEKARTGALKAEDVSKVLPGLTGGREPVSDQADPEPSGDA